MTSGKPWPRGITAWTQNRQLNISIPFTWNLPHVANLARQKSMLWDDILVGGPATLLLPNYFDSMPYVTTGTKSPGILQRINPNATRTTLGCPNRCKFCAVPTLEGPFEELDDWPDLPILTDNNLLAASHKHLDRVFDRLQHHPHVDFNQGLDARLLTDYHAERLVRLQKPIVRLALDHPGQKDTWTRAYDHLRAAGITKACIKSYALVAFDTHPDECWDRCTWIEAHHINPLPMWYHELDTLQHNIITDNQRDLGWDDYERRRIMQWFYKRKKAVRYAH